MYWQQLPYSEIDRFPRERTILILPVGAIEAHGPHLPVSTDNLISEAMAESALPTLKEHGWQALILPTLPFTVAEFASEFCGTLSFSPATVQAWFADLGNNLQKGGWRYLAIANSHLDPTHLGTLQAVIADFPLQVIFPDLTRRRWASQMSAEFQSGACHAGQYEGSVVLARQPDWTRPMQHLADVQHSLVEAIRSGKKSFVQAGGKQAYFGSPRLATAQEGVETIARLGQILSQAILEQVQPST